MILRRLPSESRTIFLTFDDGPDAFSTPRVLDLLARKSVAATFFLIGEKIPASRALVHRMRDEGHAIGNHSADHRYHHFFRRKEHMKTWMGESDSLFAGEGISTVGFRPPAGILTPHLKRAAVETGHPVILWNERFFDTVLPWSAASARKSAAKLEGGSIVLLHDRQSPRRLENFLATLEIYIDGLRARGFEFSRLTSAQTVANTLSVSSDYTSQSETVPR